MKASVLSTLDRSRVEIENDGVRFTIPGQPEPWFIGGVKDSELDIRRWTERWRAIIGIEPGPFFPGVTPRRAWSCENLTEHQYANLGRETARKAGVSPRNVALSLRRGFVQRTIEKAGPVLAAGQARFGSVRSLNYYSPVVRLLEEELKAKAPPRRR